MAFDTGVDVIDMNLMQLPWQDKGNRLILNQPNRCSALALAKSDEIRTRIALLVKKLGYEMAHICYPGMRRGLEVFASMADEQGNALTPVHPKLSQINQEEIDSTMNTNQPIITDPYNTPVASELEISWDEVYRSKDAFWVICQKTQRVLFASPAAIEANGNKPPTEILNTEINTLWEDEALDNLTRLVNLTNGWLHGHSNIGYRWQRNTEEGGVIWTRKKHEFHVDYHKINYLGLECRFEHVKAAIPV